jgi:hypothetical protein
VIDRVIKIHCLEVLKELGGGPHEVIVDWGYQRHWLVWGRLLIVEGLLDLFFWYNLGLSDRWDDVSDWRTLKLVMIISLKIHWCLSLWLIIRGGIKVFLRILVINRCSRLLTLHCEAENSLYLKFLVLLI